MMDENSSKEFIQALNGEQNEPAVMLFREHSININE